MSKKKSLSPMHQMDTALSFCLSLIVLIGCSEPKLNLKKIQSSLSVSSKDNFCIETPKVELVSEKIIFIFDRSGQGTPSNARPAESIGTLIGKNENGYYQFASIISSSQHIPSSGLSVQEFTTDLSKIHEHSKSPLSGHSSNNPLVFDEVKKIIQNDINTSPDEYSAYIIYYISDQAFLLGPRRSDFPQGFRDTPRFKSAYKDFLNTITDLINTVDRPVHVNGVHFGTLNNGLWFDPPGNIEDLKEISQVGHGKFFDLEKGDELEINDVKEWQPENVIPWNLKEFLVYNLNAGFCLDGNVGVDSDMDGMCDRDEIKANQIHAEALKLEGKSFDPASRFSFGDGYGDFFHWLRFKYPGKTLPACEDRSDEDFDLLTNCEEKEIVRISSNNDILKANPKIFDTDKDGILDGIEAFVYFASQNTGRTTRYTVPLDSRNLYDNPDGEEMALVQIKQHRNPWFKDPHAEAYDTTLIPIPDSIGGDCYQFKQSILPLYKTLEVKEENTLPGFGHSAGENMVMVYYVQVPQIEPESLGILKYSVQKFDVKSMNPENGLQVNDSIFKEYRP